MELENVKTKAKASAKRWAIRTGILVGLLVFVGMPLYTYATLKFSYSQGDRVGFVQKLSKKGWVCKTNEGELSMVNLPGQPAQIFDFTVPNDAVAKQIDDLAGHKVSLVYEEHAGIPSRCFGETDYFVTAVRKAD